MKEPRHGAIAREIRATNLKAGEFSGYASVWGVLDSYGDYIAKGAFARTLRERQPLLLWQHRYAEPIGTWLEVREDAYGLFVRGKLADTQMGRDARELLRTGALNGLSIGFLDRESTTDSTGQRTLLDVLLFEISIVSFPALDVARVHDVRSSFSGPLEMRLDHVAASLAQRREGILAGLVSMNRRVDQLVATRAAQALEQEQASQQPTPAQRSAMIQDFQEWYAHVW